MAFMKNIIGTIILSLHFMACHGQRTNDERTTADEPCENCEATMEFGSKKLHWYDTLPGFNEKGPKLEISGTVYKKDGKTPAAGVILYAYHTDQSGNYTKKGNEKGWGKRHGYIRGWIKTGPDGKYKFLTLKPAPYPGGGTPAHIHLVIKEPDRKEYVVDAFVFEGDPYLTPEDLNRPNPPGGSGVIKIEQGSAIMIGRRDIILGLNVRGY
jgi:protocatechuate 3,4-dioxygenase beta subunit